MNNSGNDVYLSYPFPFRIALVNSVFYAGGKYHYMAADQFVSKGTLDIYSAILWANPTPNGHNCKSCDKVCKNLIALDYCCSYEPMKGMNCVGRGEFNE